MPNASVVARNIATGVETSTISTSSGQYRIANLPIGTYSLSITAGTFAPAQTLISQSCSTKPLPLMQRFNYNGLRQPWW
ncbi:MAG: carboxypeptidase-like regulatory domain-containing protein [Bryobacteraceae bacterium]